MRAVAVSAQVLARLGATRRLPVVGVARGALHVALDDVVVSLTAPGVPWMPNGIALDRLPARPPAVTWDPAAPPLWDPVVRPIDGRPSDVAALASWLGERVAAPPPVDLAAGAGCLIGRGPGLTPEGDDVLAGAAVGLRALAPAAGMPGARADRLARGLFPERLRGRTTALSATLLALAADAGAAPEPVHRLLGRGDRESALADLRRLGASTGAAIAAGIVLAARFLTGGTHPG